MTHLLVYDANCWSCTRFKNVIEFLDTHGRMGHLPLSEAEGEGLLNSLPPSLRLAFFHMIAPGGRVTSGADSIPDLVSLMPGGSALGASLRINPAASRPLGLFYSVLSRLHGSGSCSRDGAKGLRNH